MLVILCYILSFYIGNFNGRLSSFNPLLLRSILLIIIFFFCFNYEDVSMSCVAIINQQVIVHFRQEFLHFLFGLSRVVEG